jgi:hypothetical protein
MVKHLSLRSAQVEEKEWVGFPGGELEGVRPTALCPSCRARLADLARNPTIARSEQPLCFQCYRLTLDRERALAAAGRLDTASEARFQTALPFEPVNLARLERLRADRAAARADLQTGTGRFVDRRRRAQIAARHALQTIAATLRERSDRERQLRNPDAARALKKEVAHVLADVTHAAELQLPEAWLPFVVSR